MSSTIKKTGEGLAINPEKTPQTELNPAPQKGQDSSYNQDLEVKAPRKSANNPLLGSIFGRKGQDMASVLGISLKEVEGEGPVAQYSQDEKVAMNDPLLLKRPDDSLNNLEAERLLDYLRLS